MKKILLTFTATFLLALTAAGNALAQTNKTNPPGTPSAEFTAYPTYLHGDNKSWIIRQAEPGKSITDSVTVQNLTNKAITITLNVEEATEVNGTFTLKETAATDLGLWTKLGTQSVELGPNEKKRIPVNIQIPSNAVEKSTYLGSVLAVKESVNDQNIKIVTRIGVRIYLDIVPPGTLETNIFNATPQNIFFFVFSLIGLLAAIFYNVIHYLEKKHS